MRNGATSLLDTELAGEETGARGWEGLAEWTGGRPGEPHAPVPIVAEA